jgi:hypothetical protein
MKLAFLEFENGEQRLVWGNLGEHTKPPQREHNLEVDVAKAQRERRKLKALARNKACGFVGNHKGQKQPRRGKTKPKQQTVELEKLIGVVDSDGVHTSLW